MAQEPKVIISPNGPYLVYGNIPLLDDLSKKEFPPQEMIALCRCGQSKNTPFCDGTHIKVGWQAT